MKIGHDLYYTVYHRSLDPSYIVTYYIKCRKKCLYVYNSYYDTFSKKYISMKLAKKNPTKLQNCTNVRKKYSSSTIRIIQLSVKNMQV